MHMRNSMLFAAVAVVSLALAGCGTDENAGLKNCTTNTDCTADTEICHPTGKVCVPTCTQASDCPANQKNCAPITTIGQGSTTEKVCQCATTQLCNTDTTGQVCSTVDNICETECTADADCASFSPARTCQNGQCAPAQAAGCTANAQCTTATASKCDTTTGTCGACSVDADCSHLTGTPVCNSGVCGAVAACDPAKQDPGTAGGPDTCAYGQVCQTSACVDLTNGTCSGATSAQGYSWDKAQQPPVIVSVTATSSATSNGTTECGGAGPKIEAQVKFYAPNGLTWSNAADLFQRFQFVSSSGQVFPAAFVRTSGGSSGVKFGTFTAGSCLGGTTAPNLANRAIFMQDASGKQGNIVCLQ